MAKEIKINSNSSFANEKPIEDWEKKKGIDGFTYTKQLYIEQQKLIKEYQDICNQISQEFISHFKELITKEIDLVNINKNICQCIQLLHSGGLIKCLAGNPRTTIQAFNKNKVQKFLVSLEIPIETYYNSKKEIEDIFILKSEVEISFNKSINLTLNEG